MTRVLIDDPILKRFRGRLDARNDERIERVAPYGRRARGEACADSDYDIAVFLSGMQDRWDKAPRLADLGTQGLCETGEIVHALRFPEGAYKDRTPLMREVRRDGVEP